MVGCTLHRPCQILQQLLLDMAMIMPQSDYALGLFSSPSNHANFLFRCAGLTGMLPMSIQRTALTVLQTTNSSMCFVSNCSDPGMALA